ncbi:hypothetical protein PTKU64_84880 [Paraburkholderia terrae]|uniref:Uncharacterized protein n=1 Tax=Paraburkholderia terrae TaxID=311230 RepID=A0ABN6JXY0_9BURK|nr:hypothetical protein PTKU64_84880 [Paraburkholderia terrae]
MYDDIFRRDPTAAVGVELRVRGLHFDGGIEVHGEGVRGCGCTSDRGRDFEHALNVNRLMRHREIHAGDEVELIKI